MVKVITIVALSLSALLGVLYYTSNNKQEIEQLLSTHSITGVYKLVEVESNEVSCLGCSFQPYLIFKDNGILVTAIGGASEYKIKDNFIFIAKTESANSYMKIEDNNTIVGISMLNCCKWEKISQEQYDKEMKESKNSKKKR